MTEEEIRKELESTSTIAELYKAMCTLRKQGCDSSLVDKLGREQRRKLMSGANVVKTLIKVFPDASSASISNVTSLSIADANFNDMNVLEVLRTNQIVL